MRENHVFLFRIFLKLGAVLVSSCPGIVCWERLVYGWCPFLQKASFRVALACLWCTRNEGSVVIVMAVIYLMTWVKRRQFWFCFRTKHTSWNTSRLVLLFMLFCSKVGQKQSSAVNYLFSPPFHAILLSQEICYFCMFIDKENTWN